MQIITDDSSYTMPLSLVPTGASWLPSSLQIITFIMGEIIYQTGIPPLKTHANSSGTWKVHTSSTRPAMLL